MRLLPRLLLLLLIFICSGSSICQISSIGIGSNAEYTAQRLQILTGNHALFHAPIRRYDPKNLTEYLLFLEQSESISTRDWDDLRYAYTENNDWVENLKFDYNYSSINREKEFIDSTNTFFTYSSNIKNGSVRSEGRILQPKKSFLNHFYKTSAYLFEGESDFFNIKINPLLNFKIFNTNDDDLLFENQRGIELRGDIDSRVYFYTSLLESQTRYASYVRSFTDKFGAVPGVGFFKDFNSTLFNTNNSYDFFIGEGHVGVNISDHIGLQFGHGHHFIGNGMRSLLLSNFSTNYLYIKFDTRVWKFHYQNIFAELSAETPRSDGRDELLTKKYMATHFLNFQISKNIDIGLFETVIFSREDQFEFQYLNPLILYRTIEGSIGSPDNVLLGFNISWSFLKRFNLYSQLVFDEFKLDELIIERRGWWANKIGVQAGAKYINAFGINHLDLQAEYNLVRPYTYSHRDSTSNYSHYNQALAHPLGANFQEILFRLRYSPTKRITVEAHVLFVDTGEDPPGENFGSNILIPNTDISTTRPFGNSVGQGIETDTRLVSIDLSYQLYHNMFLDLRYQRRNKNSVDDALDRTDSYIGGGIRINLSQRRDLY